jgi:hypothetical protein
LIEQAQAGKTQHIRVIPLGQEKQTVASKHVVVETVAQEKAIEGSQAVAPKHVVVETGGEEEQDKGDRETQAGVPKHVVVETVEEEENESTNAKSSANEASKEKTELEGLARGVHATDAAKAAQKQEWDRLGRELRERKATKSDDAVVPEYLWEEHLLSDGPTSWEVSEEDRPRLRRAMDLLRQWMLKWWKKRVTTSFLEWTHNQYKGLRDIGSDAPGAANLELGNYSWIKAGKRDIYHEKYTWLDTGKDNYGVWWRRRVFLAGRDLVPRLWWYCKGSTVYLVELGRWIAPVSLEVAKLVYGDYSRRFEGMLLVSKASLHRKPQRDASNGTAWERMKAKLEKVRKRRYIGEAFIRSLTSFFVVPKGIDDIQMVYDGTVSGLNESIWVPRFVLPTIETHLRGVDEHTFMSDVDVGDCFLNFVLHQELQELAGVDF